MLDGAITIRAVPVGGTGKNSPLNTPASWPAAPMGYVHDQRGDMKKAPSTILATAGLTVGMLGFALPASAATTPGTTPNPVHTGLKTPPPILGGGAGGQGGGAGGTGGFGGTGGGTKTGGGTGGTGGVGGTGGTKTGGGTGGTGGGTKTGGGTGGVGGAGGSAGGGTKSGGGTKGSGGKGGFGGGKTPPKHHPKPVYHPKPKPKPAPTCHPQPKPPVKPLEYNKHSNKDKGYTTALYSWQHPKSGHIVKCDPKPVKHPVKHPAPPKHHHHSPKKHWWQGWFH